VHSLEIAARCLILLEIVGCSIMHRLILQCKVMDCLGMLNLKLQVGCLEINSRTCSWQLDRLHKELSSRPSIRCHHLCKTNPASSLPSQHKTLSTYSVNAHQLKTNRKVYLDPLHKPLIKNQHLTEGTKKNKRELND
jgi:hypothetical protein